MRSAKYFCICTVFFLVSMLQFTYYRKGGDTLKLFYDILFTVDKYFQLQEVEFGDSHVSDTYTLLFKNWIAGKRHITSVFPLTEEQTQGDFSWDGDSFFFKRLKTDNEGFYYLILRQDYLEELLINALNLVTDGIQIYGRFY